MTVTEASPDVAAETVAPAPSAPPAGLAAVVGSGDPRTLGELFIGTALVFLLASGVTGLLSGIERIDTSGTDILGDATNQVFTFHAVSGLFLVVLPLLLGLATAVVPLQVGAPTLAFPRASSAAYWTYLVSGCLVSAAFALDGGPFGSDAASVELFLVSLVAVLAALALATVSVVTTVWAVRAPGMTLRRTPLFSWSMLVAGVVWLLTLPVLAALLVLSWVDFRHGQQFFVPEGSRSIYDHIAWVFWQPTVYAFAVPALGIVADIVPTFAQRRHYRHTAAMALLGLLAAVGFGAWAQLGATIDGSGTPAPWLFEGPWVVVAFVAIVPVLGLLGLWGTTLRKGRPKLGAPLVLGVAGALLVLLGVAAGAGTAIDALDLEGTTWMSGQASAVLLGALTAGFAGIAFWAPKVFGKVLPDGLAALAGALLLVGTAVYAVPDGASGLLGQLRLVAGGIEGVNEADVDTVEVLNLVSVVGGAVVLLGVLAFLAALLRPRGRASVPDDPWGGHTLEWATTSPPPVGNFAELPPIESEAPVYDARHATTEVAG